jgi:hypothetical protein
MAGMSEVGDLQSTASASRPSELLVPPTQNMVVAFAGAARPMAAMANSTTSRRTLPYQPPVLAVPLTCVADYVSRHSY